MRNKPLSSKKSSSKSSVIFLFNFIPRPVSARADIMCGLLSPDSCSQLAGLPGVPSGQHGAQLSPHPSAGGQSADRPLPIFTGRLRQRHLQDEQLFHCNSQASGKTTGGEINVTLQVRKHLLTWAA